MESVEKIADKVVDEARTRTGTHLCLDDEWDELRNHIAAALRAERAKLETFAAENGRLRKALDRIAYGPFGATEADQVTPTNISTATEVENSSEHIPTLYIGVSVHPCSQDRRWYLTTDAGLSPDDVREGARPRIFRLPSTADAERAKERERLSKERDDAAHAMWGNSLGSTASVRVPIDLWKAWMKATDALATFEATHGIGGGA